MIANADIIWPPDMDEVCKRIVAVLMFPRIAYRSNELRRRLKAEGITQSKPTIDNHLGHLLEKQLIIRVENNPTEVWYSFNWDRWGDVDKSILESIANKRILEEKMNKFNMLSLDEQIEYVHNIWVVTTLLSLKDLMEAWIDPKKDAVFQSNLRNYDAHRSVVTARILENCKELGDGYAQTILLKLKKLIDEYFEKELSPTNPDIE